jgi:hypothetical protein
MSRGRSPSLTGKLAYLPADACRFPAVGTSRCAVSASAVAGGPTMATRKPKDQQDASERETPTARWRSEMSLADPVTNTWPPAVLRDDRAKCQLRRFGWGPATLLPWR